jgi:hypothetical protein
MAARKNSKRLATLGQLASTRGRSGAELGVQAKMLKIKSATTILELAHAVGIAYEAFYEPWAKVGAPKIDVPEQKEAAKHWKDFLRESGYVWPRHYKLLRSLWIIHRKMDFLKPNSANLPNSIDAISKVCSVKLTDKQQKALVRGLTQSHTAKDVAALITQVKTGKADDLDDLDAEATDELLSQGKSPTVPKQSILSVAADLLANETVISADNRHAEPNHLGFIVVLCHVDPIAKRVSEIGVLSNDDLVEEAIRLAHLKLSDLKSVEAA